METTTQARPRRAGRSRASARGRDAETPREDYDLLTAMLMGVAIGTAVTMLFRRGPSGSPAGMMVAAAGRSARLVGKRARRGTSWVGDRLPSVDDVTDEIGDYLSAARDTISDTVSDELRDLRKAIRRQRKRIGV